MGGFEIVIYPCSQRIDWLSCRVFARRLFACRMDIGFGVCHLGDALFDVFFGGEYGVESVHSGKMHGLYGEFGGRAH